MSSLMRCFSKNLLRNSFKAYSKPYQSCLISTTKKNKEDIKQTCEEGGINFERPDLNRNWVSYGFSVDSKEEDENYMHSLFFAGITLCCVVSSFYFLYFPDMGEDDWTEREAHLELRRREAAGLPLIDPNYIPVEQVILPPDDELRNEDIII